MKFRYFVSYRYNDTDNSFGCNTTEHLREIIKALNIENAIVYDNQLEKLRDDILC